MKAPHDARMPAGLPADRAFVIQLRADADPGAGVLRGRIEHIGSGRAARFESVDELVGYLGDGIGAGSMPTTEKAP
jgi:hypothetical protein